MENVKRPEFPVRNTLKGIHILLVEDLPDNQLLITKFLTVDGATVEVANDGEEGVMMATSKSVNERGYDIILMDIQMPRVDGYEALRQLRQVGCNKPIVALTAHGLGEERARCLSLGFDEFLPKPVQRSLLLNVVFSLVTRARVGAESI